jgi:glycosyltransferase involved in cell wall biosynthesis
LEVVVFSAFNFKRPLKRRYTYQGISVIQIAIPQLPHKEKSLLMLINNALIRWISPLVIGKNYLKSWQFYHSTMLIPTSAAVSHWAKSYSKKHIGQAIGDDVNIYLPRTFNSKWLIHSLKDIDYIQFNSEALRLRYLQYLNLKLGQGFVLYRGVSLFQFKNIEKLKSNHGFNFLYLGGMQTYDIASYEFLNTKGGHIIMEAWKRIEKSYPHAYLIFGGPGVESVKLKAWLAELNYPDRVTVLEKIVSPEKVPEMIAASHVVVIPSLFEGLPNLANEAQACGVPVIGSNAGGIPETVIHEFTGRIFPKNDVNALVENMAYFMINPEQIAIYGVRGRKRMENHFSWENYRKTIKLLLEE